ncbi:MAG: TerB family tellurite resistance protein [Acidiferrobacterales bacterium]|nr:TerB family tellurite resistance protein [Acidiferrobacterales bacterium]
MFKALQDLLQSSSTADQSKDQTLDVKLASATLMFELIRSDGRIDEVEMSHMKNLLSKQFDLTNADLEALISLAEQNAKEATSLYSFTREICDNWDNEKRLQLLENLWVLALSDDVIDPHERHLVRKVAGLLYLNESQIIQSRENAKYRLETHAG